MYLFFLFLDAYLNILRGLQGTSSLSEILLTDIQYKKTLLSLGCHNTTCNMQHTGILFSLILITSTQTYVDTMNYLVNTKGVEKKCKIYI